LPALGSALWRNRFKILRPTIVVALLTFLVVIMIPSKYQSEARVLVIGRDNIYLRPDADKDLIDRNVIDQEAVVSQAQLVLSRDSRQGSDRQAQAQRAARIRIRR